jgi:hypothetical protein
MDAASRSSASRFALFVLLAIVLGAAMPMSAEAAYPTGADLVPVDSTHPDQLVLSYVARFGQTNNVTVTPAGDGYTITDTGASTLAPSSPS